MRSPERAERHWLAMAVAPLWTITNLKDFNFHAYYPSQKSQAIFPDHPRAKLEDAIQALLLMKQAIAQQHSSAKIFIVWQDEAHDHEQHKRESELQQYLDFFNRFNIEQNMSILQDIN